MNDRELLEAAAAAAQNGAVWHASLGMGIPSAGPIPVLWRPLDDDGDALRSAVRLAILVDPTGVMTKAVTCNRPPETDPVELHNGEPNAGCRRVIVRAAALMANAKPLQQPVFGAA